MTLVAVSRFFQKLTKMNFAENKNMRSICLLHRPVCYYVGGYMRGKKKNQKAPAYFTVHYSAVATAFREECPACLGTYPGWGVSVSASPESSPRGIMSLGPVLGAQETGSKALGSVSDMTAVAWQVMQPSSRRTRSRLVHSGCRPPWRCPRCGALKWDAEL